MAGRKSLKEEIKIVERLTELSEPTFKVIKDALLAEYKEDDTDERRRIVKADKKWAAEQMVKLYAKCIPTELANDPENPFEVKVVQVAKEVADKNNVIDTSTSNNSEGQASV